jgi:hypothetical protein
MSELRPLVVQFVQKVVAAERSRALGASESDAAQHVLERLYQQLAPLLGPAGFNALLARSLVLGRRVHPGLARVSVGSQGSLAGIDDPSGEGDEQTQGALAIVAHFIELLVVLVGEDLAMVLMRDIWPKAAEEENT